MIIGVIRVWLDSVVLFAKCGVLSIFDKKKWEIQLSYKTQGTYATKDDNWRNFWPPDWVLENIDCSPCFLFSWLFHRISSGKHFALFFFRCLISFQDIEKNARSSLLNRYILTYGIKFCLERGICLKIILQLPEKQVCFF